MSTPEPTTPTPTPAAPVATLPPDAPRRCQNCGAELLGTTCYACGQPIKGLVRHFSSIAGDFLDSVFDFDSRTVRTLGPLLVRPGYLSNEYFAGRRVRYVSPVRLFVFLCIVSFFVLQFVVDPDFVGGSDNALRSAQTPEEVERLRATMVAELEKARQSLDDASIPVDLQQAIAEVDATAQKRLAELQRQPAAAENGEEPGIRIDVEESDTGIVLNGERWDAETNPLRIDALPDAANDWLNEILGRSEANLRRVQEQPRLLVDALLQTLPQTFFVLLPLFALLLKIAYLFKRRLYMEHLIVALHSHAFLCLSVLLLVGVDSLRGLAGEGFIAGTLGWVETAIWIWMPLYLLLMQKRVYGQGWIMTLLKFTMIGIAYLFLLSIGLAFNLTLNLVTL